MSFAIDYAVAFIEALNRIDADDLTDMHDPDLDIPWLVTQACPIELPTGRGSAIFLGLFKEGSTRFSKSFGSIRMSSRIKKVSGQARDDHDQSPRSLRMTKDNHHEKFPEKSPEKSPENSPPPS